MWLFAEITSFLLPLTGDRFKYSNLTPVVTVTKLNQRSQSAGNSILFKNGSTSETLRYKSILPLIAQQSAAHSCAIGKKKISVHVPIHSKPLSDIDFGHYLAGLIDGDGHFSNTPQLVIAFNQLDASLAYYVKGRIGYGNIYKVKKKKAVILVVSKGEGIRRVIELINGKIRSDSIHRIANQINKNILSNPRFLQGPPLPPTGERRSSRGVYKNNDSNLNNHWLAGFSDADGSFQIKLISKNQRTEGTPQSGEFPVRGMFPSKQFRRETSFGIRLNFQIDQKENTLLILIKNFLGGNIGYRKSQDTYYYGSTSFGSAVKVINYFNQYHLLSSKHLNYLKWRKAYTLIQNKEHLTESGLKKITKLKATMNRGCSDNLDLD